MVIRERNLKDFEHEYWDLNNFVRISMRFVFEY